jgi:1,4-dihydroxy-2-naphthoate octaprenyltransferase
MVDKLEDKLVQLVVVELLEEVEDVKKAVDMDHKLVVEQQK